MPIPTITERLADALRTSGLKPAELARRCGVTRGAVSQWLKGGVTNFRPEHLFCVADALGIEARWLATGQGPRVRQIVSRQQADLLDAYHHLSPDARRAVALLVDQIAEKSGDYTP